ncbi:MAG: hypothetical protein WC570_03215 [Patescibacteria group bacterium]
MGEEHLSLNAIKELIRNELKRVTIKMNENHRKTLRELEHIHRKVRAISVDVARIYRGDDDEPFDPKDKRYHRFLLNDDETKS